MAKLPPVTRTGKLAVDPADWVSAVDFVNRVNWLFEAYDVKGILDAFLPDASVFHALGVMHGREENIEFLTKHYPAYIPGVSRLAINHIVEPDGDGVLVRYQNPMVRNVWPKDAAAHRDGKVFEDATLPAIWTNSIVVDRLRRTKDGWKIFEKHIGGFAQNTSFDPADPSPEAMADTLPASIPSAETLR
ncbi:nuclear transport factor 2 family protein [Streptomyces solisilvae]|uniref:nuclear transport factor 2 family protein n=1 Tax=Streptomyces malaysiensis TaxID=92644 RepID=UPI00369BA037